ncbi:MAG: hypothetical protein PHN31_00845 [Candidatus Gracilibacteria bacterium]|nr:hypothetical protein [Candidatus Gracilibacteria bacterium]
MLEAENVCYNIGLNELKSGELCKNIDQVTKTIKQLYLIGDELKIVIDNIIKTYNKEKGTKISFQDILNINEKEVNKNKVIDINNILILLLNKFEIKIELKNNVLLDIKGTISDIKNHVIKVIGNEDDIINLINLSILIISLIYNIKRKTDTIIEKTENLNSDMEEIRTTINNLSNPEQRKLIKSICKKAENNPIFTSYIVDKKHLSLRNMILSLKYNQNNDRYLFNRIGTDIAIVLEKSKTKRMTYETVNLIIEFIDTYREFMELIPGYEIDDKKEKSVNTINSKNILSYENNILTISANYILSHKNDFNLINLYKNNETFRNIIDSKSSELGISTENIDNIGNIILNIFSKFNIRILLDKNISISLMGNIDNLEDIKIVYEGKSSNISEKIEIIKYLKNALIKLNTLKNKKPLIEKVKGDKIELLKEEISSLSHIEQKKFIQTLYNEALKNPNLNEIMESGSSKSQICGKLTKLIEHYNKSNISFLAHQKLNTNLNQVHKFSKTQKFYKETIDAIANLLIHNSFLLTALNLKSIESTDMKEDNSKLINEEQIIIPKVEIEEIQDYTIQQAQITSNPEEVNTDKKQKIIDSLRKEGEIIPNKKRKRQEDINTSKISNIRLFKYVNSLNIEGQIDFLRIIIKNYENIDDSKYSKNLSESRKIGYIISKYNTITSLLETNLLINLFNVYNKTEKLTEKSIEWIMNCIAKNQTLIEGINIETKEEKITEKNNVLIINPENLNNLTKIHQKNLLTIICRNASNSPVFQIKIAKLLPISKIITILEISNLITQKNKVSIRNQLNNFFGNENDKLSDNIIELLIQLNNKYPNLFNGINNETLSTQHIKERKNTTIQIFNEPDGISDNNKSEIDNKKKKPRKKMNKEIKLSEEEINEKSGIINNLLESLSHNGQLEFLNELIKLTEETLGLKEFTIDINRPFLKLVNLINQNNSIDFFNNNKLRTHLRTIYEYSKNARLNNETIKYIINIFLKNPILLEKIDLNKKYEEDTPITTTHWRTTPSNSKKDLNSGNNNYMRGKTLEYKETHETGGDNFLLFSGGDTESEQGFGGIEQLLSNGLGESITDIIGSYLIEQGNIYKEEGTGDKYKTNLNGLKFKKLSVEKLPDLVNFLNSCIRGTIKGNIKFANKTGQNLKTLKNLQEKFNKEGRLINGDFEEFEIKEFDISGILDGKKYIKKRIIYDIKEAVFKSNRRRNITSVFNLDVLNLLIEFYKINI